MNSHQNVSNTTLSIVFQFNLYIRTECQVTRQSVHDHHSVLTSYPAIMFTSSCTSEVPKLLKPDFGSIVKKAIAPMSAICTESVSKKLSILALGRPNQSLLNRQKTQNSKLDKTQSTSTLCTTWTSKSGPKLILSCYSFGGTRQRKPSPHVPHTRCVSICGHTSSYS